MEKLSESDGKQVLKDTQNWNISRDCIARPKLETPHSYLNDLIIGTDPFLSTVSFKVIKLIKRDTPVGLWKNSVSALEWCAGTPPRRPLINHTAKP